VVWIGVGLALAAAVLLAYVPRLPSSHGPDGLAGTGVRLTPGTNRRLRIFATAQIALSFVLLAGAGMLVASLMALQSSNAGFDVRQVLALDVPAPLGEFGAKSIDFYQEVNRRIGELPGVEGVAVGNLVPWRDAGSYGPGVTFAIEGHTPADGEEEPRGRLRIVSPGYFDVLGVPLIAGRHFTEDDRRGSEAVVIVSQSLAQRLFPGGEALNRKMWWTDPYFGKPLPRRVVGIVADIDDESVVRGPAMAVYHPFRQMGVGGRVFVRASGDPYALVPAIKRVVREIAPDQPVERAATLEDVRAEVLTPDRLNAFVISGFAAVALLISVVGVAGVLAFSVSARVREFGVRLAIGSSPFSLLLAVLFEGATIVAFGIAAGLVGGYAFAGVATAYLANLQLPGLVPTLTAAAVLGGAAVLASLMPAARAAQVDVLQALRSE
jgi:putative ABC transport system permease protein